MESLDQVFRCVLPCYYRLLSAFSPFCTTKLFSNVFLSVLGTSHSQLPSLDFFAFHQPFSFVNLVNAVRRSKSKPITWILQPLQSKSFFQLTLSVQPFSSLWHPQRRHNLEIACEPLPLETWPDNYQCRSRVPRAQGSWNYPLSGIFF